MLMHPFVLALLHAGHGVDGDSPAVLLRVKHYLTEPQHALPAVIAAALMAALVALRRRRALPPE